MRQKGLLLTALCLLLCLSGCALRQAQEDPTNPIAFYYQLAEATFGSDNGVLGIEEHDFGAQIPTLQEITDVYFGGPTDETLISPFPKEIQAQAFSLDNGVLTITLDDSFSKLNGIGYTVASACLTKTMTQIKGVSSVCIETASQKQLETSKPMTSMDYVCRELGAENAETTVRLYFSDPNGRYLVAEERSSTFSEASQIPGYVMQQLIAGPEQENLLSTVPEGTRLLSIDVDEGGACVVDLSSEFLYNKPNTESTERMTVYSIVNSLTELEQIKTVRILVEGKPVGVYLDMDLTEPYTRDASAIGVVRTKLHETDATLYVKCWREGTLAAVPVCIRGTGGMTETEALLQELLTFKARNGLSSAIPSGTAVQNLEKKNGICYIDLSEKFLSCSGNRAAELLAVRSIAATLATLDGIDGVRISVGGQYKGLRYVDLTDVLVPQANWFFP